MRTPIQVNTIGKVVHHVPPSGSDSKKLGVSTTKQQILLLQTPTSSVHFRKHFDDIFSIPQIFRHRSRRNLWVPYIVNSMGCSTELNGTPPNSMEFYGVPLNSMEFHGNPLNISWSFMELTSPWSSMEVTNDK